MLGADRWCGRLSAPSIGEHDSTVDARRLPDVVSRGRFVVSGSGNTRAGMRCRTWCFFRLFLRVRVCFHSGARNVGYVACISAHQTALIPAVQVAINVRIPPASRATFEIPVCHSYLPYKQETVLLTGTDMQYPVTRLPGDFRD